MASSDDNAYALTVIDALDHPHGHRILRTRVSEGKPPTLKRLKAGSLRAQGPDGEQVSVRVVGFPVFGGSPSNARIRETGRVDLVVEGDGQITRLWELRPG